MMRLNQKRKLVGTIAVVTMVIIVATYLLEFTDDRIHIAQTQLTEKMKVSIEGVIQMVAREQKEIGVICLNTNPALFEDEFELNTDFLAYGQYCANNNKTFSFNINFNIERTFTLGSSYNYKKSMKYLMKQDNLKMATDVKDGIPQRFHFIWTDAIIPSVFVENLKRFRTLHPNWEINFWTLKYGRTVVEKLEPHILALYDGYKSDTARADALRYVLMYHYGGAYLDIDIDPKIPFDNLTMMGDCLIGPEPLEHAFFVLGMRSLLNNAVLFCKPKHAFFRYLIDQLPSTSKVKDLMSLTGPKFVTKHFNYFINSHLRNNLSSITNPETVTISIFRHDYFEFWVQKSIFRQVIKDCKTIASEVQYFMEHCLMNQSDSSNCTEILSNKDPKHRLLFDACVEWTRHGEEKREVINSIVYAHHVHYSTRERLGTLKYKQENNITRILPNAIVHL